MKKGNMIVKHGLLGLGITVTALVLPLLKFYVVAPQYFLQTFQFLA